MRLCLCVLFLFSANKNTVPGDKSALRPGGIRIGTPAITTRNMKEKEMVIIGNLIDASIRIAVEIERSFGLSGKVSSFADFEKKLLELDFSTKVEKLRNEVEEFASFFPMPGLQ